MQDLKGKTALVTGAASGLGRELALALGREGALVLLVGIDASGLEESAAMLQRMGAEARRYLADVSDRGDVEAMAARVRVEFGAPDVLINNAGVFAWADFIDTTPEDWDWNMGVNLWGPVNVTRAFLPDMIERGSGHIVNVASLGGLVTMPTLSAYPTTKFGLVGLTETLQLELVPRGIAVTLVCPGNLRTPIVDHIVVRGYDREKLIRASYGMMPRMSASRAAASILRGMKKGKAVIVLTPLAHFMWYAKRLSPALYRMALGGPMHRIYERMR